MVPLRVVAETLGCTVDWFDTNNTVLINPRENDGSEMSVFERLDQSGLFWNYETDSSEYLVWKDKYRTLSEASNPSNFDSWWIERPKDTSNLENQSLDCTIIMREFAKDDLAQVKFNLISSDTSQDKISISSECEYKPSVIIFTYESIL